MTKFIFINALIIFQKVLNNRFNYIPSKFLQSLERKMRIEITHHSDVCLMMMDVTNVVDIMKTVDAPTLADRLSEYYEIVENKLSYSEIFKFEVFNDFICMANGIGQQNSASHVFQVSSSSPFTWSEYFDLFF